MKSFLEIAIREIKIFYSQKGLFFLVLLVPLLLGLFLGLIFSSKVVTKMSVGILNDDNGNLSRTIERYIDSSRSFKIKKRFQSISELQDSLYSGDIVAALYISKDFENSIKLGKSADAILYLNGANLVHANLSLSEMKTIMMTISSGIKLKILRKLGYTKEKALALSLPIKMDITKNFNPAGNYLNLLPPGTWMALMYQIILLCASFVIIREKENKIWKEVNDLSKNHSGILLLGKLIPYAIFFFLYFELFYRLLFPLFGIEFRGNYELMMLLTSFFIFSTLGLGFLVSLNVERSLDAVKAVLLIGSPAFILSGYTWPLSAFPLILKGIAYLLPLTHFLTGFRKIYQQDASFHHIAGNLLALFLYFFLTFFLSIYLLKKKGKRDV